jgi:thioredoxin 1
MYRRHSRKALASLSVMLGLTVILQTASTAAPSAASPQAQVTQAKAELGKGSLDSAIQLFTKATKSLGTTPGSCDAHFGLGKALCSRAKKTKNNADMIAAKRELRTAIRVGKGNAISKQANDYMMANIPKEMLSPKFGEGTEFIAAKLGLRSSDRGVGGASKPKVFEFYADWCEPCKMLKPVIAKMREEYGDQVEIASINVDDKNNAEMLEQYDVSPIPTVIFMNPDGQVVGYSIGFAGERTVQKEMQKLVVPAAPVANKS